MSLTVHGRLTKALEKYIPLLEGEAERAFVCAGIAKIVRETWPAVADDLEAAAYGAHTRHRRKWPHWILDVVAWCEDHTHDGVQCQTPRTQREHLEWLVKNNYGLPTSQRRVIEPFSGITGASQNTLVFAAILRALCPDAAATFLAVTGTGSARLQERML